MTRIRQIKRIVFCDFDGTITDEESFVDLFKHFLPELFVKKQKDLRQKKITLAEAVRMLVESIPSSRYHELLDYFVKKRFRHGFEELLSFLKNRNIPFVVISGGLVELVEAKLGHLQEQVEAVYAATFDTSGEYLKIFSEYEAGEELVSKVAVMDQYDFIESAVIGNGLTDRKMAMHSSMVFARDGLARYLSKKGKPYYLWDNFFDIIDHLKKIWKID